ncbi:MAG: DJ-1/PfpI family protein [Treponema sp.]|nr:DJ-1/PfpI family protein [Treponema sp.]
MVAVFLADGFEEIEALSSVDYLRRAKVDVRLVAVTSKNPIDPRMVKSSHDVTILADITLEDFLSSININEKDSLPDALFFPGGLPGATNLAASEDLKQLILSCFENGKYVTAMCASPALVLAPTGILKGKNWTCYPGMEEDVDPETVEDSTHASGVPFVTDGKLVTGAGPGTAEQFAMELVRIFAGEETAEKIRKGSCLR